MTSEGTCERVEIQLVVFYRALPSTFLKSEKLAHFERVHSEFMTDSTLVLTIQQDLSTDSDAMILGNTLTIGDYVLHFREEKK
jgi:hypothetical protein